MQQQLSQKELFALEDHLNGEMMLTNKFNYMASECQDQELKQLFSQVAQKHQGHYDQLLQVLNKH